MQIIEQHWEWEQKFPPDTLKILERIGRTCYKSENKIGSGTDKKFIQMIVGNGHHAIIEHVIASVRVVTNRGVSLELVRHRLCSVAQESSRYCNYGRKDMEFIRPVWWDCDDSEYTIMAQNRFLKSCQSAEYDYRYLLDCGWRPEQAREVLPNSLKTELVMTANLREWLHIFSLRTSERAHPQMRALMRSIQEGFRSDLPEVYGL